MNIVNFTPVPALVGGLLIGLATGLALLMNGKIAGISGVLGRIFRGVPGDTEWRIYFVLGLVVGGAAIFALYPPSAAYVAMATPMQMIVAGLLVGFGARVGGGCTSGHGVCGISRRSIRGLVGTVTFMAAGFVTVYVLNHVVGLR
jgi:uncharacterized membrane protein YedE/YeeE